MKLFNKRIIIGAAVTMVVGYGLDIALSIAFLSDQIAALKHIWRPDAAKLYWIVLVNYPVFYFIFVGLFDRVQSEGGAMAGLGFGLVIGIFFSVPSAMMQYVFYPIPLVLALGWVATGVFTQSVCGLVLGLLWPRLKPGSS